MDIDAWLAAAVSDARRRGLEPLIPFLETLARSTRALRAADEISRAQPEPPGGPQPQNAS